MTDNHASQVIAQVDRDASVPSRTALGRRSDAPMTPSTGSQHDPRKVAPALQRTKEPVSSSQANALKTRLSIDGKHCGAFTL